MDRKNVYKRGHALRIAIGLTMLVLVLGGGAGAATEINSCTNISSPGEYVLNLSIINSISSRCINITSSDVILDGAGYSIDGIDTWTDYGIYIYNPSTTLTNVTVKNLKVTDWYVGIHYQNAKNGAVKKFGVEED